MQSELDFAKGFLCPFLLDPLHLQKIFQPLKSTINSSFFAINHSSPKRFLPGKELRMLLGLQTMSWIHISIFLSSQLLQVRLPLQPCTVFCTAHSLTPSSNHPINKHTTRASQQSSQQLLMHREYHGPRSLLCLENLKPCSVVIALRVSWAPLPPLLLTLSYLHTHLG